MTITTSIATSDVEAAPDDATKLRALVRSTAELGYKIAHNIALRDASKKAAERGLIVTGLTLESTVEKDDGIIERVWIAATASPENTEGENA